MWFVGLGIAIIVLTACGRAGQPTAVPEMTPTAAGNEARAETADVQTTDGESAAPLSGASPGGVEVILTPSQARLQVGDTIEVEIEARGVENLYGVELYVAIPVTAFEVVDADPLSRGIQIRHGTLLSPDYVVLNAVDEETNTIGYAVSQLPPHKGRSGDGSLARFTLRALKRGAFELPLQVILADATGSEIAANVTGVTLTVD